MAKNFRIESLSKDQQSQLKQIADQYFPGQLKQQFLDSIEKNGTITPELFKQGNFNPQDQQKVLGLLSPVISSLPSARDAYQKVIDSNVSDPANLTDQQIQDKLDAYQGITSLSSGTLDVGKVKDYIKGKLSEAIPDLDQATLDGVSAVAAQKAVNNEGLGSLYVGTGNQILGNIFSDDRFTKQIYDYVDTLRPPQDQSLQVSSLQDILAGRKSTAIGNEKVNQFLSTAPGQLDAERQSFFNSQRNKAQDYITGSYAPQVAEQLSARGLGDSGQVGAAIQSKYSDLLQGIDSSQLDQMFKDSQFFADQSYNKVFSDLINARQDVTSTVDFQNQNLRTNQATDFAKRQADIESQFNLDLFRRQSAAAYQTYQAQTTKQRQQAQDAQNAQTVGQVGGLIGTAIGSYAGPAGAAVGNKVGSEAGKSMK